MEEKEFEGLSPEQRVAWLNQEDPFHDWQLGVSIKCLHCDGTFVAEEVKCVEGYACCPVCVKAGLGPFTNPTCGHPHDWSEGLKAPT